MCTHARMAAICVLGDYQCINKMYGTRCGLMVSRAASGSSGQGSSPGRAGVIVLCSWARHFFLIVLLALSIQDEPEPVSFMLRTRNPTMD